MSRSPHVEVASPAEWASAFGIIFQYLEPPERAARVENALRLVQRGQLPPTALWVAHASGELVGAVVCLPVPGASALVWPPQAIEGTRRTEIEDLLLASTVPWLQRHGAKLAQTLLAPEEIRLSGPLERNGFRRITRLWYMRHDLDLPQRWLAENRSLNLQSYDRCDRKLFRQSLLGSYEGTLDCPEVNGVRTLDEILEGHKAQGVHDPERWWLAMESGQPAGVLLLTAIPEWQGWDLSYLGVVPAARRRGVGRELARKALRDAHAAGARQVTLSVDERNRPAWELYRSLGFVMCEQREVYLAIW